MVPDRKRSGWDVTEHSLTHLGEHLQSFYGWCSLRESTLHAEGTQVKTTATSRSFLLDETNQKTRYENRGKERGRVKASTQLFYGWYSSSRAPTTLMYAGKILLPANHFKKCCGRQLCNGAAKGSALRKAACRKRSDSGFNSHRLHQQSFYGRCVEYRAGYLG